MVIPEVTLVERQRRLAVQLVEHVARGLGDLSLGSERIPTAERSVPHLESRAVEPDRHHRVAVSPAAVQHHGFLEQLTVGRQAAGHRDTGGQPLAQPAHQGLAVDVEAFGNHQHVDQARVGEGLGQGGASGRAVHGSHRRRGDANLGVVEVNGGGDDAGVKHLGADDLPGGRAPDDRRRRPARAEGGAQLRVDNARAVTEHQHQLGVVAVAGMLPSLVRRPAFLPNLHTDTLTQMIGRARG
ncbi:MAG: hypothetical protein FD127_4391 [Acidimicrobiaceae bacterium]|nr:MAG: hypothetical protein FD127_4391 [Acidimicrobiaceae bacterium]